MEKKQKFLKSFEILEKFKTKLFKDICLKVYSPSEDKIRYFIILNDFKDVLEITERQFENLKE